MGLPVVAVYGKLKLVALELILVTVPKVMVGNAFTVADALIFCVVAPVEVQVIFPDGVPVADADNLAYTVVLETVPPD